jgi:hypothetical protein
VVVESMVSAGKSEGFCAESATEAFVCGELGLRLEEVALGLRLILGWRFFRARVIVMGPPDGALRLGYLARWESFLASSDYVLVVETFLESIVEVDFCGTRRVRGHPPEFIFQNFRVQLFAAKPGAVKQSLVSIPWVREIYNPYLILDIREKIVDDGLFITVFKVPVIRTSV